MRFESLLVGVIHHTSKTRRPNFRRSGSRSARPIVCSDLSCTYQPPSMDSPIFLCSAGLFTCLFSLVIFPMVVSQTNIQNQQTPMNKYWLLPIQDLQNSSQIKHGILSNTIYIIRCPLVISHSHGKLTLCKWFTYYIRTMAFHRKVLDNQKVMIGSRVPPGRWIVQIQKQPMILGPLSFPF